MSAAGSPATDGSEGCASNPPAANVLRRIVLWRMLLQGKFKAADQTPAAFFLIGD